MTQRFPLLPLRDIVVFPGMVVPIFVGRERSVAALEAAMEGDKDIFLLAQLDPSCEEPGGSDLYDVGVIAQILQMLKMPDGTVRVLVEGTSRAQLSELQDEGAVTFAQVRPMEQAPVSGSEVTALMRTVIEQFADYAKLSKKNEGAAEELGEIDDAAALADAVAAALAIKVSDKQGLLTEPDPRKRLEMLLNFMEGELSVLQVERRIRGRVKRQMEKTQREYYLNEQMKAIQNELGDGEDGKNEVAELEARIADTKLSKEAKEKVDAYSKNMAPNPPQIFTFVLGSSLSEKHKRLLGDIASPLQYVDDGDVGALITKMGTYYERQEYLYTSQTAKVWLTLPYFDFSGIGLCISAAVPVYQDVGQANEKQVGVAAVDLAVLDLFGSLATPIDVPDGSLSFAFMIDLDGRVLYHPSLPDPDSSSNDPIFVSLDKILFATRCSATDADVSGAAIMRHMMTGGKGSARAKIRMNVARGSEAEGSRAVEFCCTVHWQNTLLR